MYFSKSVLLSWLTAAGVNISVSHNSGVIQFSVGAFQLQFFWREKRHSLTLKEQEP